MKRKLGLTAALVCAMALVGYAQSKPDFSGTWTLDASKSEMGDMGGGGGGGRMGRGMMGGPITITQTADALRAGRGLALVGSALTLLLGIVAAVAVARGIGARRKEYA